MNIQQMIDTIRQALPPKGDIAVGQHFEANSNISPDMLHTLADNVERLMAWADKLHTVMAEMAKTTPADVMVELAIEHEIDITDILSSTAHWYNEDPNDVHERFEREEVSESYLAYVLGVDRLESRVAHEEWLKNKNCAYCGEIPDLCTCGTLPDFCDDCLELLEDCTCHLICPDCGDYTCHCNDDDGEQYVTPFMSI